MGDPGMRPEGIERLLIRAGLEVAEAQLTDPLGAEPAIVLLNAAGEVDAAGALEILRRKLPAGVPVIVTVEDVDPDGVVRTLEAGAADVIAAPVHLPELLARILARFRASRQATDATRLTEQAAKLFDVFEDVAVGSRAEEIVHTLVRRLGSVLPLGHCAGLIIGGREADARLVAVHDNPRLRDAPASLDAYPEARKAVRTVAPAVMPSGAAVPLVVRGRAVGAVVLRPLPGQRLQPDQVEFAARLVRGTGRVLEAQERRASMARRQSGIGGADPLTRCASLDALDQRLTDEFERARRYQLTFSLVLMDVDGLGVVNASHGQAAGDRVLADLGAMLQRELRGPDFVARYGGDEFALLLPETGQVGARRSLERFRERLEQQPFAGPPGVQRPTITAGIITYPDPAVVQKEDLLRLAETALRQAKTETAAKV
jgi:diguanylate cyclase (GGDEF)-like protein